MRWLLLDKFEFIDIDGGKAQARRAITRAEDFFEDSFNFCPVFPPVLMIEMIAQTGGVLVGASLNFSKEIILGKIDWARFPNEIVPPAILTVDAWITDRSEDGTRIEGKIMAEDKVLCEASILLGHLDRLQTELLQGGESVVFSDEFLTSYRIKEVLGVSVR
ncbi:MAG: hypothetical protein HZC17_07845 [Candidatus Omnitrophica bacterium]|nr:hypothetical protein [Candidatus Omnitrophota bacterium]